VSFERCNKQGLADIEIRGSEVFVAEQKIFDCVYRSAAAGNIHQRTSQLVSERANVGLALLGKRLDKLEEVKCTYSKQRFCWVRNWSKYSGERSRSTHFLDYLADAG
jgi:hypothetical protein